MVQFFRDIVQHREFLREHVLQTLRARYRGSVLGFIWTLLNPLLIWISFGFIFSRVNHVNLEQFLPHFLAGYVPWMFFVGSSTAATSSIVGSSNYVNRMYVPKAIFPVSVVLVNMVDFIAGLASFFLFVMVVFPQQLHPTALFIPVAFAILLVFVTGISLLFATVNVFFRDFQFLWATISFVWFFLVPILFTPENMPDAVRTMNQFNVMYPMLRMFQDPLAKGLLPPVDLVGLSAAYAMVALIAGSAAFFRWQREFYMYV
jgi:ABC-type polysaccharide/polyol phosphate export permease